MAAVQAAGSYGSPDAVFLPPSRQPGRYGLYVDATPLTEALRSASFGVTRFSAVVSRDVGRGSLGSFATARASRFVPLPSKHSSTARDSTETTPLSTDADDEYPNIVTATQIAAPKRITIPISPGLRTATRDLRHLMEVPLSQPRFTKAVRAVLVGARQKFVVLGQACETPLSGRTSTTP